MEKVLLKSKAAETEKPQSNEVKEEGTKKKGKGLSLLTMEMTCSCVCGPDCECGCGCCG